MRVSILGMGNMGRAFAARAIETGHQTTVWNRTPGRVAVLVDSGAIEADTPSAAVAGADAVLVVLADDAAVLDVCLGDDGVLASLEPDAVFANVSTVSPETARRLAELGPEGRVIDAPVMGSPAMIAGGFGEIPHRRSGRSDFCPCILVERPWVRLRPLWAGRNRGNDEGLGQLVADHGGRCAG